jgi:hypothetical protein
VSLTVLLGSLLKKEPRDIMRLFKLLKAYNQREAEGAIMGIGAIRAKDYENNKLGHLLLFSYNIKVAKIFKLFIPF